MAARVNFITTHGTYNLNAQNDETFLNLLHRYRIPWTAVCAYIQGVEGNYNILQCLDKKPNEFNDETIISLFFQRNINPFTYDQSKIEFTGTSDGNQAVTEYIYRDMKNGATAPTIIKSLSVNECQAIVNKQVSIMLEEHLHDDDEPFKIVVGISGGGDSNALIVALNNYSKSKKLELIPVIIGGAGEWDTGIPRAQAICDEIGLNLTIITEQEAREIIGASTDGPPLVDRFYKTFPDDDFEFLGTLIIRLCLARVAKMHRAQYICTGLNSEDLLAEVFAQLLSEKPPLPFPVRSIGELKLIYPLWQVPKKIIDGCFPKYSFDNYQERYPSHAEGRTLFYSLAYWVGAEFPQVGEKLLRTFSKLSFDATSPFVFDEEFGFETMGSIPLPLRAKFKKMLA